MRLLFSFLALLPLAVFAQYNGTGSVSQGFGNTTSPNIYTCLGGRTPALGTIQGSGAQSWILPAVVNFENTSFPFAPDLHNPCNGATYANLNAALAVLDGSEIITIDPDGELISAYVFADNYFEMFINGVPVGKDKAPYTQFNSSLLHFRVKRPFSIAMLLVDWEEHLGLGTEANGPSPYHAGDGGMVAVFKNETGEVIAKTNSEWKAQTFYTAPVKNLACLTETGNQRVSNTCDTQDGTDGSAWYGVHWQRPVNWMQSDFDQSVWPSAVEYSNAVVGVNNKPAYTNFTGIFDQPGQDAAFIWSSNLILDNEVLVRHTVPALSSVLAPEESGAIRLIQRGEGLIRITDAAGLPAQNLNSILLLDLSGRQIRSSNTDKAEITSSGISPGLYLLRFNYAGKIVHRKIRIN